MKLNENIKLIGKNVILVPYEAKHVEKYHSWMKSPELQELTASEVLSIEEEYDMQKSWRIDDDKCTFLILDKTKFEVTGNEIDSLIGDTNLFLQPKDEEGEIIAETEIMIAEILSRGKKYGWESMLMMIKYGIESIKITKYLAKIGQDNIKSISMFNKMGFKEISRSNVFREITFERKVDDDLRRFLELEVGYDIKEYK